MIQDWSYCVIVCYFLLNVVVTILHFRRENLKSYSNSLLLIIQSLLMLSSIGLTIWTLSLVDDYDHEIGRDTFFSSDSLRRTMLIIEVCTFLGSINGIVYYLFVAALYSEKFLRSENNTIQSFNCSHTIGPSEPFLKDNNRLEVDQDVLIIIAQKLYPAKLPFNIIVCSMAVLVHMMTPEKQSGYFTEYSYLLSIVIVYNVFLGYQYLHIMTNSHNEQSQFYLIAKSPKLGNAIWYLTIANFILVNFILSAEPWWKINGKDLWVISLIAIHGDHGKDFETVSAKLLSVNEVAREKPQHQVYLQMSQYSFTFMGLSYAYDKDSDTISKEKLFKKKAKDEDVTTINEKKERLRITASELDLNFMICFLIFLAQAAL